MSEATTKITLPMEVEYKPAWISWVAAVTGCLDALGCDVDLIDVAGQSGYASHISVRPDTCPSGPTMLDWDSLNWGIRALGRTVDFFWSGECYTGKFINDRTRAHAKKAFEFAKSEIEAGRPCVVWGLHIPEFGICVGIDGDSYITKTCKGHELAPGESEPNVKWDEIEAPGGPCVIAFPTATGFDKRRSDHAAVTNAVNRFNFYLPPTKQGADAYDAWIFGLKNGKAHKFGNSYLSQCYAEGRAFAKGFFHRIAERNEFAKDDLKKVGDLYAEAEDAMIVLAKVFPFCMDPGLVDDKMAITAAVPALERAKAAEVEAIGLLRKVADMDAWWEKAEC